MSLAKETKRCPFCQEQISATAIRCKHCHADLSGPEKQSKNRLGKYDNFRVGFISGIIFSAVMAILAYLQCNGQ